MEDNFFGMISLGSRLKGVPTVRVSIFAIAAVIAFFAADTSVWTLLCISAAVLHEAAHIAAVKLCREKIESVNIYPFGAEINIKGGISTYANDLAVSSAGVIANSAVFLTFFSVDNLYCKFFAAANIVLAAVNLIPVKGLDGGRIAESLLYMFLEYELASRIYIWLTYASMGLLAAVSAAAVILCDYNVSAAFVCAYMLIAVYVKDKCRLES